MSPSSTEQFIGKDAKKIVRDLRAQIERHKLVFSDIADEKGNQYVDLVMEGGGMLGIALVGYTYVLEEAGIRFLNIGGTSAGAINALLLASIGTMSDAKSKRVIEHLVKFDPATILDGDAGAKKFVRHMLKQTGKAHFVWKLLTTTYHSTGILDEVRNNEMGLNPGVKFLEWIKDVLKENNVATTADLEAKLKSIPQLHHRLAGRKVDDLKARLAMVAADISTQTKIILPEMADMLWNDYRSVNPAEYVRASMSVPMFFQPVKIQSIEKSISESQRAEFQQKWEMVGYSLSEFDLPKNHYLVDGGIISNFPINLFHKSSAVPRMPTFGVKLGKTKRRIEIENASHLAVGTFNAARTSLDREFIMKHPDYQHLIATIDTEGFKWLDFEMTEQKKRELFLKGATAAAEFLLRFDWEKYKKIRAELARANESTNKLSMSSRENEPLAPSREGIRLLDPIEEKSKTVTR